MAWPCRKRHGVQGIGMTETIIPIPSETEFTIHRPTAGWHVELLTTMDEIDYAVSAYSYRRGKRPGMAMQITTWQILGSLLSNRAPMNRGEDGAPQLVISEHHDPDTITFFDDET
jgi:hypothetical protein